MIINCELASATDVGKYFNKNVFKSRQTLKNFARQVISDRQRHCPHAQASNVKLLTTDQKSRHHKTIPKKPSNDEHSQQGEKSLLPKRVQF